MDKKQLVTIIIVSILITILICVIILHNYISEREFESNNTSGQLRGILGSCACQERIRTNPDTIERCPQPFIDWQNSTHYIDNQICTFLDITENSPTYGKQIKYDEPLCLPPYDRNVIDECIPVVKP